jgi:hypothetical protein
MLPDLPKVGDRTPSALDKAYAGYREWCDWRGLPSASFASWLKQEQGLNPASAGTGVVFRPRSEQLSWKQAHSAEIEARRHAAIRELGITPAMR